MGQKSQILPTPFSFSALVRGDFRRIYGKALRFLKLKSSIRRWRFGNPSLERFWLIHPCDRQTDGQTELRWLRHAKSISCFRAKKWRVICSFNLWTCCRSTISLFAVDFRFVLLQFNVVSMFVSMFVASILFNRKPITKLRRVTYHMGSHSVSCHQTYCRWKRPVLIIYNTSQTG